MRQDDLAGQAAGNVQHPSHPHHIGHVQADPCVVQAGQQQFQPPGNVHEPGMSDASQMYPQPHGYQQPPAMPAAHMQCPAPNGRHVDAYSQQYTDNPTPVPSTIVVKAVPESTPSVPQEPAPGRVHPGTTAGVSVFQQPPVSNVAAPSQTQVSTTRKDSQPSEDEVLMHNLNETIADTVAEVNENEQVTDSVATGLQSLPQDPNLECVMCHKVFKIGQIQNYKRHVVTCTGSKQQHH